MYLQLQGLSKIYDGDAVVDDFTLNVGKGELISILGPSGCGKTTTLRMIGGFVSPTEGEIFLSGERITDFPPEIRPVSTVFQNYALFPHLTVYENIAYGLRYPLKVGKKLEKPEKIERVRKVMELVNLTGLEKRKIGELSGGQQQRVALARSLILEPKVLLLDEPLSNIDTKLRATVRSEIRKIQKALNITMILVTHDQEEAMSISDRIVVMNKGRIEQTGTPREIYRFPESVFVADFIGKANIFIIDGKEHVVRPENVRLSSEKIEGEIWGKGVITGKEYQGAFVQYTLKNEDGVNINSLTIFGNLEYSEGNKVWYNISKEDLYRIDRR